VKPNATVIFKGVPAVYIKWKYCPGYSSGLIFTYITGDMAQAVHCYSIV